MDAVEVWPSATRELNGNDFRSKAHRGSIRYVPRLHHVNLGVLPEVVDAEESFLVDVLGYHRIQPNSAGLVRRARWFEGDDGTQVHLGVDPDHRPAAIAHTAVDVSGESAAIEQRLTAAGVPFRAVEIDGLRAVHCQDPAGNRWELRS